MYVQLTTRCNMNCQHCLYSCTSKGEDMSHSTFYVAMMLAARFDQYITLGGGEPTLARDFAHIIEDLRKWLLLDSMGGLEGAFMVTNGTRKRNTFLAIKLMEEMEELEQPQRFQVVLSANDGFHDDDKIHRDVWSYFWSRENRQRAQYGGRQEFIRSVRRLVPIGRALENENILRNYFHADDLVRPVCACEDWHVKPDGSIRACGCPDAPAIGNVYFPQSIDERYAHGRCYRESEMEMKEHEQEEVAPIQA